MTELLVSYGVLHVSRRKTIALPYIQFMLPEVGRIHHGGKSVVFWRSEFLWSEGTASIVQLMAAYAICHCTNLKGLPVLLEAS
jgi:hypothetical protein